MEPIVEPLSVTIRSGVTICDVVSVAELADFANADVRIRTSRNDPMNL
jgi:hypothetical protein